MSAGLRARLLKAADAPYGELNWKMFVTLLREAAAALDGQGDAAERLSQHVAAELEHRGQLLPEFDASDVQPTILAALKAAGDAAPRVAWQDMWQDIETLPSKEKEVFFWLVPRHAEECYTDTSGNPITAIGTPGRLHRGKRGTWSPLMKATHWHPMLRPPKTSGSDGEAQTKEKEENDGSN